jgi:hypothetical protein
MAKAQKKPNSAAAPGQRRESRAPATGYIDRVLAFGATVKPGEIARVHVMHDPRCPRLRNGPCRCTPDITVVALIERSA